MSRIVDDEPPIKTHPANRAYRENFDRIFGEPRVGAGPNVTIVEEGFDEAAKKLIAPDADAIECRLKLYANYEPPAHVASFPVESCVGCGVVLEPEPRPPTCEDCYRHDPACAKLCTEDADCDCGWE